MDMATPPNLTFRKMHGAGNDFVVIDSRGREPVTTPALARALGDRHRGVGFDQLAELRTGDDADFILDFWNADGTMAGACGNATRCVAWLVMEETGRDALTIRTARGLLQAQRLDGQVWVNMGLPMFDWQSIPLNAPQDALHLPLAGDPVGVGMGNPHCVFVVPDAEAVALDSLGPQVEHDPIFPERTNVEYISLLGPDRLRMRVWERGTGITLACGSGACAAAVAAVERGLTARRVVLELDGGILEADWRADGVWLTGPVADVFTATLTPAFLAAL
ncbi:diaminopimelate epimerase [Pararhodobacter zhoushanensis]|uniref:Diaminopimelate epimerase n=1 Tax=Pararhodobacter zhoushanensis TaxID=2479545 RepID=A0ABT3GW54_9RHOB|nr:diaminopimelate epimerase [Pararhodobacter zhoushanensis]MCW1931762.1 diaminopimelate epimerase [Pararhodobacter zhoushanensis]